MVSQICNEPESDSILKVLTNPVQKKELGNIPKTCFLNRGLVVSTIQQQE